MSESGNESDFASAESDHTGPGTPEANEGVKTTHSEPLSSEQNVPVTDSKAEKEPEVECAVTTPTVPSEAVSKDITEQSATQSVGSDDHVPSKDPPEEDGERPPDPKPTTEDTSGSWGWGGWGGLWSSVSTVTESAQALGQKVSSVIASVEEGLGLPSPTELAEEKETEEMSRLAEDVVEHDPTPLDQPPIIEEPHHTPIPDTDNKEQSGDTDIQAQGDDKSYTGFFSGFASAVQTTGKGLVSGGLDVLETLGKKTMEVLSEGDPGLQNKRALLPGQGAPTLSQLLQEAKSRPEGGSEASGTDMQTPLNYSRLFDEYHGVVHLEALELLSKECDTKVRNGFSALIGEELEQLREKVEEMEGLFQVVEDQEALDDDSSKLAEILDLFSLPLKVEKLIKVSNSWREKVEQTTPTEAITEQTTPTSDVTTPTDVGNDDKCTEGSTESTKESTCETLYENGLRSLAELTSASIELFRKMAELTLLPTADKGEPIEKANKLNRLTVLVCTELDCLASVHSEAITQLDLPHTNSSVTSLYLEASNSGTYVQDAFQLLLPVLKHILIQQLSAEEPEPNVLSRT